MTCTTVDPHSSRASTSSESPSLAHRSVSPSLRRFAWFNLAYNVLVILWGAIVRATGSGGGCGDHWPLCNGVVLPQLARFHTLVEFTHRMMSGTSLLLIAVLLIWTWRGTSKGNLARWAAGAAMVLVLNEALLGALLVLLGLVGQNHSFGRGVYLSIHFANTLLLLGALTLAAEFLSHLRTGATTTLRQGKLVFPILGLLTTLIVGVSGSLAALGDTLFPSTSLSGAFHQDFSPTASLLLRLRWIHPASACLAAAFIAWLLVRSLRRAAPTRTRSLGTALLATLILQFVLGILDVLLLAPTWLQILHLLGADILWICLVLLAAEYCLLDPSAFPKLVEPAR